MLLKDINLDYVKNYLNVDHELDDVRLKSHISSAISYILKSHNYKSIDETDNNEALTDLAMIIIQDMYDNGTITTKDAISFLSIDRRF